MNLEQATRLENIYLSEFVRELKKALAEKEGIPVQEVELPLSLMLDVLMVIDFHLRGYYDEENLGTLDVLLETCPFFKQWHDFVRANREDIETLPIDCASEDIWSIEKMSQRLQVVE